jgi:hypothetical protein
LNLAGGLLYALLERVLQPLKPDLVLGERLDLGLHLLQLPLGTRLEQGDVLPLLRDLPLQLLRGLFEPLNLLQDDLLVRLPQLALQTEILF